MTFDESDDYHDLDGGNEQYDNKISELPLSKFYSALNNNNHVNYTPKLCKGYIQTRASDGEKFYELCAKLEYKLLYHSDIKELSNVPDNKLCDYFNYWLGDQISMINNTSSNVTQIGQAFNMAYLVYVNNSCSCQTEKFRKKNFSHMKFFFDFSENLEAIDLKKDEFNTLFGGFYCDYINKAVNKYNEIIENDSCKENTCTYYDELQGFKDKYNTHYLSLNDKCSGRIQCIKKTKVEFESTCTPLPDISARHGYSQEELHQEEDNKNMSKTNAIITLFCTILSIFFLLFYLYKFTSFGSWLHPKICRKKTVLDDLQDDEHHFLNGTANGNINFNNNRYNIAYHSA
ncbi:PIR Superfamily Protein [Plasmodium ovale curtisi]|uniref:PIR Superfamily Protein n=1 Tax=Plasmodium ovale curtisi TaxID=864141 RepID=A0A1A8WPX9_PLAOA|nr:PIR Superfamily Protein [Plasmodium ovale curtisi]